MKSLHPVREAITHIFFFLTDQMGLDIVCGDLNERVGSYSGVQRQRIAWIEAESKRQKSMGNVKAAEAMKKVIVSADEIDYALFEKTDGWLPGTRAFVDHSDCDGMWDAYEAAEILEAVRLLKPFFETDDYFDEDGEYYLEEILRYAVKHQKDILFC